ncbi:MAG: uroporphyrinogen decarboxylase [Chloroflexota bacterium]
MNDTILGACRGEEVPYTPVWILRQSGRYLPQFRRLLNKWGFLNLCKKPELIVEVTMLPVDLFGVDAAQAFSDILTEVEPMGMELDYSADSVPHFKNPIRTQQDVDHLVVPDAEESLGYRMEAIKMLRRELADRVPLLGFAGGPFTVAAYMIEGGPSNRFINTKRMMFQGTELFHRLMRMVTALTGDYLRAQVRAGAQAVTVFDTWASILSERDFTEYVLPYVQSIVKTLSGENAPVMYFTNGCAHLVDQIRKSGVDVLSADWRISLDELVARLDGKMAVQGNLDPFALLLPVRKLEARIKEILDAGRKARGHIFNLGDGIFPEAPLDNVAAMVEAVHNFSRR